MHASAVTFGPIFGAATLMMKQEHSFRLFTEIYLHWMYVQVDIITLSLSDLSVDECLSFLIWLVMRMLADR
jgi:hypothetical protein